MYIFQGTIWKYLSDGLHISFNSFKVINGEKISGEKDIANKC